MSDQELEMQAEADEILEYEEEGIDSEAEELDEKAATKKEAKASFGDPSEVPEPDTKKTDEKKKGKGDSAEKVKKESVEGNATPKTKVGMINAMLNAMKGMKKDDLAASWGKINAALHLPDEDEDDEDDEDKEKEESKKSVKEVKKITKEDIDVDEDVKALFGDEDLSDKFKNTATTIFEAAVVSKVNEILTDATIDLDSDLEVEKEDMIESMSSRLDDYLEYVVEEWMKENEIAVQQGIRMEITENFMQGLRQIFEQNYIDIPEEKTDLVDDLASKVQELEISVNSEMEKNISFSKEINEMKKEKVLQNISEDLSETQTEKLKSLSDGIEFEDEDDYKEKLETVKENYFPSEETVESDEEPLEIEDDKEADGSMSAYMHAISRSIKK